MEGVEARAEGVEYAGAEALDHGVGGVDQSQEGLPVVVRAQIERDRALAAVQRVEEGWSEAEGIAPCRVLDLVAVHFGSQVISPDVPVAPLVQAFLRIGVHLGATR